MNQKVPTGVVVAGNPAKVIRNITPEDEEFWKTGKQLYIDLAKKYLKIGLQSVDRNDSTSARTRTEKRLGKRKCRKGD